VKGEPTAEIATPSQAQETRIDEPNEMNIPISPLPPISSATYSPATTRKVAGTKSSINVELTSLNLSGSTTTPRSYDFIIPFENISSLQLGWPLIFSPQASQCLGRPNFQFQNLQIVGILGYYSKGKSFILNHLYKIATEGSEFTVLTGPSVTTRGFSGLFMDNGKTIEHANLLIIDTAGRNAPAFRIPPQYMGDQHSHSSNNEHGDTTTTAAAAPPAPAASTAVMSSSRLSSDDNGLGKQIDEIRAKERLIDDVIVDIANTIIYVVDEVLNEDQRTLLHLVGTISRQRRAQKLILVHNFKRIDYVNGDRHTREQIIGAFGATPHQLNSQQQKICGPLLQVWNSNYPILTTPGDFTQVIHVALFNQQTSTAYNMATFNFLVSITSPAPGQTTPQNPIDRIIGSIADCLPTVVKVLDPPDGIESKVEPGSVSVPSFQSDLQEDEVASMVIRLEGQKTVELLRWDLLQLPTREGHGAWKPTQNNFIFNDTFYARIDLPGLNESHRRDTPPTDNSTDPGNCNWWSFTPEKKRNLEYKSYLISGYRKRSLDGDEQTVFGEFVVQLRIPHCFAHKVEYKLTDGTLIIVGYENVS
jgi:hypothetical protein